MFVFLRSHFQPFSKFPSACAVPLAALSKLQFLPASFNTGIRSLVSLCHSLWSQKSSSHNTADLLLVNLNIYSYDQHLELTHMDEFFIKYQVNVLFDDFTQFLKLQKVLNYFQVCLALINNTKILIISHTPIWLISKIQSHICLTNITSNFS